MGIVHHSNYIRWMEEARLALLESVNLSYAEMERIGLLIPVFSVSFDYKLPFKYGEICKIVLYPIYYNGIKFKFGYKMYDEEGKIHNIAESSHCFTNAGLNPVSIKKSFPDIYETLKKWVDENQVEEES